ncbi:MAG: type II toxin-antitoxin system VapC family toxin [Rhizobiaceae bacterium]
MSLVLDASAALAWLFEDETTEAVDGVFDRIARSGAVVPSLWLLEIASGLRGALVRKRVTEAYMLESLERFRVLPIEIDPETGLHAWGVTLALAKRHSLTVYDATYLELAQRKRLPLATLDNNLGRAAPAADVECLLA